MQSPKNVLATGADKHYGRLRLRYDRLYLNMPDLLETWTNPVEHNSISQSMHEWNTANKHNTPGGVVEGVDSFSIYRICVTARGSMSSEALMQQRLEDISWINEMMIPWYKNVSKVQGFFGLNLRDVEFKNGVAVFKVRIQEFIMRSILVSHVYYRNAMPSACLMRWVIQNTWNQSLALEF
jgi:hypothetical protein